MSRETSRGRRPFKVWDSSRVSRKALVVSSLEELIVRGREKLGIGGHESVRAVLETDGTQVDDSEYFRSLPDNTVFLLLRPGERWSPAGVDVIRAALSSIPRIVCEAISSLDLQNEVPAWKIMESRGRITIVLTWDQRPPPPGASTTPSSRHAPPLSTTHKFDAFARRISPMSLSPQSGPGSVSPQPPFPPPPPSHQTGWPMPGPAGGRVLTGVRTMITRDGKLETVINGRGAMTPSITVISHEEPPYDQVPGARRVPSSVPPPLPPHQSSTPSSAHAYPYPPRAGLPRQGSSSLESATSSAPVHIHTVECAQRGHFPPHPPHGSGGRSGSPPEPSTCDFHCCALHEEGRKIQVHKTVATSPIDQQGMEAAAAALGRTGAPASPIPGSSAAAAAAAAGRPLHVRFTGVADDKNGQRGLLGTAAGTLKKPGPATFLGIPTTTTVVQHHPPPSGPRGGYVDEGTTTTDSSESETENNSTMLEEEGLTSLKFLLLTDQLSLDQKRHLSIKDIGVILERLSSKIIDVEKLDRETEGRDCYNWTIKATIRGEVLRELGVIYNGNYYAISEHPAYSSHGRTTGSTSSASRDVGREDSEEDMRL